MKYLAANEASYAITSHEYYADSYVSGIAGLIRATTDPEGNVTEYDYYKDGVGKGLVKSKTLKDGNTVVNTVSYEYNAQLQVSKETTSFDISKNLYSVKEYEYDKFNNVTVTRDYGTGSTPATTVAEYDLLSRKTAEYAPNYSADKSHGSLTTYYPDGNKKSETDAEGNVTSYVYDAYGQVIKKTNPDGTMNLTAYDGLQREKATYFLGSENGTKQILTKTSYEFAGYNFDIYSALDASASHSCKGLKTTKTTYITENKQVISETLTDIKEHTIYEKTNGETKRTSAYYANGQLARQTDALGNITKYEYGYLNKVTKTYTPFNTKSDGSVNYSVTENQYDKNGNVTLAKQTVQKQDSDTVKYSVTENQYNAQGLLTQVTLSDGTSNGEKNITKYFYNNAGIQTKMYTGLNSTNDSDYMTTNYEYDAWGHLVRTTDSTGYNSGATTYDLNGNALTVTDANGNVTTNTYDALNRVLTANTICSDTSKNVSKSYVYDNMGRVRSKTAIGAQTAAEIALSILAQIVQVKNARPQTEGYPVTLLDAMVQAEKAHTPAVLATIIARHGSTPRDVGAKMLVLPDGSTVGSVGGGIMEHYTVQAAQKLLAQAVPALQCLQLSADGKNEDAAVAACGGSMEVLLQTLFPGEEIK